ncbi:MAG: enoyl-CoA hydratase/isomerase family protein [SAR202 cluster bacterium]|nr:enoyl-CoA hydratase/isomerase family protein [SAR202 cluster bacterium]
MQYVQYEKHSDHIAVITLNRPERLNALGAQIVVDIEEAFCRYADDKAARVAVLRGAGKAFCAGADMREWGVKGGPPDVPEHRKVFMDPMGTPSLMKPVVAAVHGYCLGAGLNLILMRCDIRICGESTKFGMPEAERGIINVVTPFAYNNIPTCFLSELVYTCDMVSAQRAHHFGVVNTLVPDDQVFPAALRMAQRIAQQSPRAIRLTKEALQRSVEPPPTAFVWERYLTSKSFYSPESQEGMRAFVEKREPRWPADPG